MIQKFDKELMRKSNARLIFFEIYKAGKISRPKLATITGLSIVSVNRITEELMSAGFVKNSKYSKEIYVGRTPKLLEIELEKLLFISVVLKRNCSCVGIVDAYGNVMDKQDIYFKIDENSILIALEIIANKINNIIQRNKCPNIFPIVGVSIPGIVQPDKGIICFSSQLQWRNVNIIDILKEKIHIKNIIVENDVKALALAENLFGELKTYNNSVILNIGAGISAAVIIDHKIYRGQNNTAGEIGHIVINPDGKMCECGKIGCLQTNISDWAILQEAQCVKPNITLSQIFQCYEYGDLWAVNLLNKTIRYISMTIGLLSHSYAPEAILLCGSLVENYPIFQKMIYSDYKKQSNDFLNINFDLKITRLGVDSALIGAGTVAFYYAVNNLI